MTDIRAQVGSFTSRPFRMTDITAQVGSFTSRPFRMTDIRVQVGSITCGPFRMIDIRAKVGSFTSRPFRMTHTRVQVGGYLNYLGLHTSETILYRTLYRIDTLICNRKEWTFEFFSVINSAFLKIEC